MDVIRKKRDGMQLKAGEIEEFITSYAAGEVPDYQMAAFAMAVYFRGMTAEEILALTGALVASGETLGISETLGRPTADKHSTGGVGDKTSLVLVPLVSAAGVPVVKMSGRGLGHTGGTVDKLEAIPGFRTVLSPDEIIEVARSVGAVMTSQVENLVPADGMLYSLRDVTATVDSIPLIASSVMSKKLALGSRALVLDVKVGSGALIQDEERAERLAEMMVDIGRGAGIEVSALVTGMEEPLGRAVGNALEVREAIETLRGGGPRDLRELVLQLAAEMVRLAEPNRAEETIRGELRDLLDSGEALRTFARMVRAQGGDERVAEDLDLLPASRDLVAVRSRSEGYVKEIHARTVGEIARETGAGRFEKDATIDPAAGVVLYRRVGDGVRCGDLLAEIHLGCGGRPDPDFLVDRLCGAFTFSPHPVRRHSIVRRVIGG
ncbi:MAG: thymidine phosphorylase [Clostridia bacterium]